MNAPPVRRRGLRAAALALAAVLAASVGVTLAVAPANAAVSTVEVDDTQTTGNPRFEYSGNWGTDQGLPPAWFNGTEHVTGQTGASVTLHFSGTQAALYGNTHPAHGIYSVAVDGVTVGTVDAYAPALTNRQLLFDTGVLTEGDHTVTLTMTGDRNPAATNSAGQIDYAVVQQTVPAPPAAAAWAGLPQPGEQALTGEEAWSADADTRIFLLRGQQSVLQREADRLSSELADVLDRAAVPIVVGDLAQVRDGDILLQTGTVEGTTSPEAYAITVDARIAVTGATDEGVFRATRQIVQNLTATGTVPAGTVSGSPAVDERAFHLDLARQFYPADWIEAELRDMAYVGVNSFQIHFSENEGFRIESERFPQIVSAQHLTKAEVREIVALAEDLHIDVVPALNMPGHLDQVLRSFPELQLRDSNGQPVRGALDITKPEGVQLAFDLVDEYVELFPNSTHWAIGADEFIDFENVALYPSLRDEAVERFGPNADAFDLMTDFANQIADRVTEAGFTPRVWNDGMLRSDVVPLDPDTQIMWWTNYASGMRPVQEAFDAGHDVLNYNDSLFYYVLGEGAGYRYPTAQRIWEADWQPGIFPRLPASNTAGVTNLNQVYTQPYPEQLLGASFAIWSDQPNTDTLSSISTGIRQPLRAQNERSWNAGSDLELGDFLATEQAIGRAPGIETPLGAPGTTTILDGGVVDPPVVDPPVVDPPVVDPPVVDPPADRGGSTGSLPQTGFGSDGFLTLAILAGLMIAMGAGFVAVRRARRDS